MAVVSKGMPSAPVGDFKTAAEEDLKAAHVMAQTALRGRKAAKRRKAELKEVLQALGFMEY